MRSTIVGVIAIVIVLLLAQLVSSQIGVGCNCDIYCQVLSLPVDQVQKLLPKQQQQLMLGKQNLTAAGTHPVLVHLFNVTPIVPVKISRFSEFIVSVPYTVFKGDSTQRYYNYYVSLAVDSISSIVIEKLMGLNATRTAMTLTSKQYTVAAPMNLNQQMNQYGELYTHPDQDFPAKHNLMRVKEMYAMPFVTYASVLNTLWCYNFSLRIDSVRSMNTTLSIDAPGFLSGLPAGTYSSKGLDVDALGSIAIHGYEVLSIPHACPLK